MTASNNPFENQINNRNYLSPLGFKLIISKIPKVDFLCQAANIPSISMGTAVQPTYLKDICNNDIQRAAIDYITGMTDEYALRFSKKFDKSLAKDVFEGRL